MMIYCTASQFHDFSQCGRTFRFRVFSKVLILVIVVVIVAVIVTCYTYTMPVFQRNVLSIKQKMDVLKDLETASIAQVAARHKIGRRTVFRIKKEAANISQAAESANSTTIKRKSKSRFPDLEEQLYSWFVERRTLGDKLSDALLLEKAHQLQDSTIGSNPSSKVTGGWLHRFKKRKNIRLIHLHGEKASADETAAQRFKKRKNIHLIHLHGEKASADEIAVQRFKKRKNIHLIHLHGEKASADEIAAQRFISELKKQIEEEDIDLKCIYNMDETGLLWKTLATNEEINLSDSKEKKDRVTVALCANATGTHKLKPFFIHKYKKPKALRNGTDQLPVIYATQKNALMDQQLFIEWFNYFKESVKLFHLHEGICSKVILLLDNCGPHKLPINYTNDINVEIKYFPPNCTTSLIQPMDQGIIAETKQRFRHKLMERVITYAGGSTEFYKMYTIKDCIIMLANAWTDVKSDNIKNCWHKLLPYTRIHGKVGIEGGEEEENVETCIIEEMHDFRSQMSSHNVKIENVQEDESRDEGVAVTQRMSGLPLNTEERRSVEGCFAGLEKFNDRAPPELQLLLKTFKLMYLGTPYEHQSK